MESVIWSSETRIDLRYSEQSRTYGPSSFLWFFFSLVLLKVVSRKVIWLKVHDSWVWKHKSGSHRQFGVLRNGTHPWFQRTLYFFKGHFILCSWRWRRGLSKPAKMILDFFECGNEFSHMFSQFHTPWDTTMPTTESSRGQKLPLFIWNFRACLHTFVPRIIPKSDRDSLIIFCRKQNKPYWMGEPCAWLS